MQFDNEFEVDEENDIVSALKNNSRAAIACFG